MSWEIREGDCLTRLREMPAQSVQCCITSPPYFGLRDYQTGRWEGGDEGCDHVAPPTGGTRKGSALVGSGNRAGFSADGQYPELCGKCGARRIDSQIGLEPTPDEYVARLVEVFREVRRVLRDDGTLWLNLGDSYCSTDKWGGGKSGNTGKHTTNGEDVPSWAVRDRSEPIPGVKPKDLLGIPWLVAFALRADGWWLRSEIIWAKPNPMPESVTDRPTRAHEQVFLLSKSARYFYDAGAIAEASVIGPGAVRNIAPGNKGAASTRNDGDRVGVVNDGSRNRRSVWTVPTHPLAAAHFATFPPKLIEPMVLAGSARDACGECGAPWERQTLSEANGKPRNPDEAHNAGTGLAPHSGYRGTPTTRTTGWEPTCSHRLWPCRRNNALYAEHCDGCFCEAEPNAAGRSVVLDPFAGAGTTGVVSLRHGRSFIGLELNPDYCELARQRIRDDEPLFNHASEVAA